MKPIKLRAHHIGNLLDHAFSSRLTYNSDPAYDPENKIRAGSLYDRILRGQTPVTVVDDYDDLCNACSNKVEVGCLVSGQFYPSQNISEHDRQCAAEWNVEIGKTYEVSDFLKRIEASVYI